ncbi:MAG: hypothetical protein B7Z82_01600 [Halothiobacillus sp. 20-54-6]|nr:MAG: hypothetical protein B7Z82_01600 [Halothiobacillus sp. 20-54-6]
MTDGVVSVAIKPHALQPFGGFKQKTLLHIDTFIKRGMPLSVFLGLRQIDPPYPNRRGASAAMTRAGSGQILPILTVNSHGY